MAAWAQAEEEEEVRLIFVPAAFLQLLGIIPLFYVFGLEEELLGHH